MVIITSNTFINEIWQNSIGDPKTIPITDEILNIYKRRHIHEIVDPACGSWQSCSKISRKHNHLWKDLISNNIIVIRKWHKPIYGYKVIKTNKQFATHYVFYTTRIILFNNKVYEYPITDKFLYKGKKFDYNQFNDEFNELDETPPDYLDMETQPDNEPDPNIDYIDFLITQTLERLCNIR